MTHYGRTESPCHECEHHSEICHSICPRYKRFEKIHAEERAEIHKKKHIESLGYGAGFRTEREWRNTFKKGENRVFKQRVK